MSNYSKATNFAAKDALATGNAGKIVSGTEINDEFNLIATAVATKVEANAGVHTGTTTMAVVSGASSITSAAFVGPLTGNVTGNVSGNVSGNVTGNTSGTAATVTSAAQPAITSMGTLTTLQVDNININGNAITSTAGTDLTITPLAGQQVVLDGTIVVDAGVITGATSVTSTAFVGGLTGNVTGNTSGTAATVTTAAQPAITSVGTLTSLATGAITMSGRLVDAFPTGTLMLFQQTAAPTGWTKQTTHNNKSLRVVSGTASSGGTTAFTDVFTGTTTGSHVLTTANLPAHTHGAIADHTHTVPTVKPTSSSTSSITGIHYATYTYSSANSTDGGVVATSVATNAGGGHTHTSVGGGTGHTHSMDMRVQYVDLIIAAKD